MCLSEQGLGCRQVWREMVNRSRSDPQCRPNVISYSALMTVYCQAGQLDKAEDAFQHMKLQGVTPDHICYSTLIAGGAGDRLPVCSAAVVMLNSKP